MIETRAVRALFGALLSASLAHAATAQGHDHGHGHADGHGHQHGGDHTREHRHGAGRLHARLAGARLHAELTLAGADLFGEGDADARDVDAARVMFADHAPFLAPSAAAECALSAVDAAMAVVAEPGAHAGHRDFTASYTFRCAHPEALTEIRATVFERAPTLETIEATVRVADHVASAALTPGAPVIDLTRVRGRRELSAHVHGEGALDIAIDGHRVLMAFEAPGADIVGFEHSARTVEDRAAIDAARAVLADPLALFTLDAEAGCALGAASVELLDETGGHAGAGAGHDQETHSQKHDHGHDHGHGHAAAQAHGAGHDAHDHGEGGTHSAFHAEYALTCADPAAIRTIAFAYFDAFPNARRLDVAIATARGQAAFEVERANPRLMLDGAI